MLHNAIEGQGVQHEPVIAERFGPVWPDCAVWKNHGSARKSFLLPFLNQVVFCFPLDDPTLNSSMCTKEGDTYAHALHFTYIDLNAGGMPQCLRMAMRTNFNQAVATQVVWPRRSSALGSTGLSGPGQAGPGQHGATWNCHSGRGACAGMRYPQSILARRCRCGRPLRSSYQAYS